MTDKARIKIAALVTALFLATVSVAGVATRTAPPKAPAAVSVAATPTQQPAVAAFAVPAGEHEDE